MFTTLQSTCSLERDHVHVRHIGDVRVRDDRHVNEREVHEGLRTRATSLPRRAATAMAFGMFQRLPQLLVVNINVPKCADKSPRFRKSMLWHTLTTAAACTLDVLVEPRGLVCTSSRIYACERSRAQSNEWMRENFRTWPKK